MGKATLRKSYRGPRTSWAGVSGRPAWTWLALAAAVAVLGACGEAVTSTPPNDSPETSAAAAPASASVAAPDQATPSLPVTVIDEAGNEVTVESIDRIIPLDGTVAEVVFALGLGDNVVATDLSATYPPEADALPEIGYQRALAAEPIAAFAPTVLIGTDIAGPSEVLDDLRRLGYPLVIVPNEATPSGPADKIRAVATALGVPDKGEEVAGALEAAIAANTADTLDGGERPVVVALYLRGAGTQLVLGEASATRWLIEAGGGIDGSVELEIADTAPIAPEALLALKPDVILVPSAGLDSVGGIEGLLGIGGLSETPAGRNGNVLAYDDQLLLGNGPRTGALLADLSNALAHVEPAPRP